MPSSSDNGPPSSSSRSNPSKLMTRSAMASFTSPSFPAPTPPSGSKRRGFSVERIYEFEAPQFYDFTKQSDPERGNLDENWFGTDRKITISLIFNFIRF